jgi:hypothetical protein
MYYITMLYLYINIYIYISIHLFIYISIYLYMYNIFIYIILLYIFIYINNCVLCLDSEICDLRQYSNIQPKKSNPKRVKFKIIGCILLNIYSI